MFLGYFIQEKNTTGRDLTFLMQAQRNSTPFSPFAVGTSTVPMDDRWMGLANLVLILSAPSGNASF